MRVSLSAAALVAAALSVPALAHAQEAITVTGVAAIVNDDIGLARDKAIDDAKRKAVEQVAGSRVKAESVTVNFQLVQDTIVSKASGYVKSFEIKTEYKDGGAYHVKIAALVDADKIAEGVSQLFSVKPRVIVMIAEQNVGAGNYAYWWGRKGFTSEMDIMQSTLIGAWQPRGFKFIDPGMLRGKLKLKKGMKAEMDNGSALTLSKGADAEIAIVGKVAVTDAGPVMEGVKMRSFHAVGSLRVLNVDTGEIIAVIDDTGVAPHIDGNQGGRLAIKALAEKIGPALEKSILGKWTAEAASAREVELVITGALNGGQVTQVRKFLGTEVRGVEKIDVRRRKKGLVGLVVHLKGEAMDLGNALEAKAFEGFKLEVGDISKDRVQMEVAK
jgi:hypothetical protein